VHGPVSTLVKSKKKRQGLLHHIKITEQLLRYDKYTATTGRCEITPRDYCRRIENSE
jgi:hypothetical protein